jgi:hypothetical protein
MLLAEECLPRSGEKTGELAIPLDYTRDDRGNECRA